MLPGFIFVSAPAKSGRSFLYFSNEKCGLPETRQTAYVLIQLLCADRRDGLTILTFIIDRIHVINDFLF